MVKITDPFIDKMDPSIQKKAKEILVYCKNDIVRIKREKPRRKKPINIKNDY